MRSWMTGIIAAILSVGLWPALPPWPVSAFTLVLALWLLRWRHLLLARWSSGLALGTALALWHGNALLQQQLPQACVKLPLTITGTVTSLPVTALIHSGQMRQRFNFNVTSLTPLRCRGPSSVLLSYYGPQQMIPGDDWQFKVKLQRPWGLANPGGFNMQAWFAQSAINAVGSVSKGSAQRLPAFPDVPAIAEVLPGYESSAWFGLFGPGQMNPELAKRISDAARQAIASPDVKRRLEHEGAVPVGNSPEEFARFVQAEIPRWAKVVQFSGAKPE